MNLPGAGLPTFTRSAVTCSPVSRWNVTQGLGIRSNFIFWMARPVVEFMIVAMILMAVRLGGGARLRPERACGVPQAYPQGGLPFARLWLILGPISVSRPLQNETRR